MMKIKTEIILIVMVLGITISSYADNSQGSTVLPSVSAKVNHLQTYTHPKLQMTVLQSEIELTAGDWEIHNFDDLTGLKHIQFSVDGDSPKVLGSRYSKIENQKVEQHIQHLYAGIEKYAIDHANYELTLNDFKEDIQEIFNLIKRITGELGEVTPSIKSTENGLAWLNATVAPFQICIKFMEDREFGYPDYAVINDIKKKFKIKKLEDLSESQLTQLVQMPLGKSLKRIILIRRYKLQSLKRRPDQIVGPTAITEIDDYHRRLFFQQIRDYRNRTTEKSDDPKYFLIPGVALTNVKSENRVPLVLELRPFINDGKHWILFNDRTVERVDINKELLKEYEILIRPVMDDTETVQQKYHLRALVLPDSKKAWQLTLKDTGSTEQVQVLISMDQATAGTKDIFSQWKKTRAYEWARMYHIAPSTIYQTWINRMHAIYDEKTSSDPAMANPRRRGARTTSAFNLLGGRAAIEETLQMIDLNVRSSNSDNSESMLPIGQIEGVQVKGHPYEKMLAGQDGGRIALAHYVPHDRFFMHFSEPSDLAAYLDEGVTFLHQSGSDLIGNNISYDLKERYYARLGLNPQWVERFLKSKMVKEVALVLPDLFLIDGTDMTVIMKVPNLKLVSPLLKLVGVRDLIDGKISERTTSPQRKTYWTTHKELLIVSTNKNEINSVVSLIKNRGKGSLGQSAEFRYMLTKMPVKEDSKIYMYFSDPFIRRMVGPEVKIAQYRRLKERAKLESITAGALLYKNDGHQGQPTIERLVQLGYVSQKYLNKGYHLDKDMIAYSKQFGTTSGLTTILDMSLTHVNSNEAKAYKSYVDNYSRFWRQFFDPIAIRYDHKGSDESEINVFILPLIDSSIYEGARTVFNSFEPGKRLKHPAFTPEPVMTMSANINEDTWIQIVKGFGSLKRYMRLNPELFDEFGPSMHIAVLDADPIINLGSGDFLGVMGAGGAQVFRARESLWMPIAFMMFTRPTKIMFELKDAEKVLRHLKNVSSLSTSEARRDWADSTVEFTQVDDQDEWNCRISLFGLLKLRYGIKIQDGFLVFSNVPWSQQYKINFSDQEHLNSAAISLNPGAAKMQLPGLYNTALEGLGAANRRGLVYLSPLASINGDNIEQSLRQHKRLFGFTPLHSGRGKWRWKNGQLQSSTFGSVWSRRQPPYMENERDFGLFRKLHNLSVSMQFEDEGLRTKIRWTPQK